MRISHSNVPTFIFEKTLITNRIDYVEPQACAKRLSLIAATKITSPKGSVEWLTTTMESREAKGKSSLPSSQIREKSGNRKPAGPPMVRLGHWEVSWISRDHRLNRDEKIKQKKRSKKKEIQSRI